MTTMETSFVPSMKNPKGTEPEP